MFREQNSFLWRIGFETKTSDEHNDHLKFFRERQIFASIDWLIEDSQVGFENIALARQHHHIHAVLFI